MKNRIYILEDNESEFNSLCEILNSYLKSVEIFPIQENFKKKRDQLFDLKSEEILQSEHINVVNQVGKLETLDLNDDLKEKFRQDKYIYFDSILDKNIDFFIVDIALQGDKGTDNLGQEFIQYLKGKNYKNGDFHVIVYSQYTDRIKDDIEFNEEKDLLINKNETKDYNTSEITTFLNHNLKIEYTQQNLRKLSKLERWIYANSKHVVNVFIMGFFYLTIISSTIFGGYQIISEIIDICTENKLDNYNFYQNNQLEKNIKLVDNVANSDGKTSVQSKNAINTGYKKSNGETKILEFVEHIFLYVIPIFILLGFYNYYKYEMRPKLLSYPTSPNDAIAAKESIQLAKTLFLSSIMSYTIIKIIDKLFIEKRFDWSIEKLISFGMFLLIIMGYLIFSHKKHD